MPVKIDRQIELRKAFSEHLAGLAQDDLTGYDENFKEVWEECRTDEEVEYAKKVLEELIEFLGKFP